MKAVLIDAVNKTITNCNINNGLETFYKLLNCQTVTAPVVLENNDTLFCDDEALLKPAYHFFKLSYNGYENYFAGNGLIVGTNDEGGSVDVETTAEEIQRHITFMDLQQVREEVAWKKPV